MKEKRSKKDTPPEGHFWLVASVGCAGFINLAFRWVETGSWRIAVRPEDKLAEVIEKIRVAGGVTVPNNPTQFKVATSVSVELMDEHTSLRKPRIDATVADNKLEPNYVLRWEYL